MEILALLVESNGQLVSRDEIVEKIWGRDVFLDTEHGINTAIRKIRQALGDDPEQPRFVQTVTGKGYRFIAPISLVAMDEAVPLGVPVPDPWNHPINTRGNGHHVAVGDDLVSFPVAAPDLP